MAKIKSVYVCSECGYESPKWYGKCPSCGNWNTMNEEVVSKSDVSSINKRQAVYTKPVSITDISTKDEHRYITKISELDRVLGGGLVNGSLILLGGEPGIGKSTLILQILKKINC